MEFAHKKGYKYSAILLGKHYEKEGLYKAALAWYLRYSPKSPKTIELQQRIFDLRTKEREAILSENDSAAPPSIEEKGIYHPPALTKKQARLLNIPKASIHQLSPTFEE